MRSFFRIISIVLLIAWMGFIFFLSAQTADVSSQTSGGFIEFIAEKIYPDYENLTEPEKQEVVSSFQFIARKSAHVGVFAVLGFLAFSVFISYTELRYFTRVFWASAVSMAYAASDEYHQRFVAGRSCELRDFLLDCAGILVMILICALFFKIVAPLRQKTLFAGNSKKQLEELNAMLNEKLDFTVSHNEDLENRIEEYKSKVKQLESELKWRPVIKEETTITEETEIMEKREVKLSDEMEYASAVIGAVVVEATKLCNKLTEGQDVTRKELINLALGRTEVLKAEMLKILSRDIPFEEKKQLIENEKRDAYDYFDSIIAQTC